MNLDFQDISNKLLRKINPAYEILNHLYNKLFSKIKMTKPTHNLHRTLNHLKRLIRDGENLINNQPLDEMKHAKWFQRAGSYVERKIPGIKIPPPTKLIQIKMPNFLAPDYTPPNNSAAARAEQGKKLMEQMMMIISRIIERLELELEVDEQG